MVQYVSMKIFFNILNSPEDADRVSVTYVVVSHLPNAIHPTVIPGNPIKHLPIILIISAKRFPSLSFIILIPLCPSSITQQFLGPELLVSL